MMRPTSALYPVAFLFLSLTAPLCLADQRTAQPVQTIQIPLNPLPFDLEGAGIFAFFVVAFAYAKVMFDAAKRRSLFCRCAQEPPSKRMYGFHVALAALRQHASTIVFGLTLAGTLLTASYRSAIAQSTKYQTFILHTDTALETAPDNFAFALAPNRDLFIIKKRNTGTNTTEVHVLSATSGYKEFSLHTGTALEVAPDDFAFALAPNRDLFIVKKRNTDTKTTEIRVLSAASGYKEFSLDTDTALEVAPDNFDFALASNLDLFAIKKRNTGTNTTEVHVLSAASKYKQFSLQTGTALEVAPDDFDFALAPNRDLFVIKKRNTGTNTTEVHVLSAALEYKQFSLHTGTALEVAPDDFAFVLADKRDLFAIKKQHTGTNSTEVHVLLAPDTLGLGLQCPNARNDTSFDLERHGVLEYRDGDIRVVNVFWAPDWDSIAEHKPQGSSPGFLRADINAGTKALIGSNFFSRACQYGGVPYVFNSEAAPPWASVNVCSRTKSKRQVYSHRSVYARVLPGSVRGHSASRMPAALRRRF